MAEHVDAAPFITMPYFTLLHLTNRENTCDELVDFTLHILIKQIHGCLFHNIIYNKTNICYVLVYFT